MFFKTLLGFLKAGSRGHSARSRQLRRRTVRPQLEPLEDRCLLSNFSTFLGGSQSDSGNDIAVDAAGNTYLVGSTESADFPATAGAFDGSYNGSRDAFVAKLGPDGTVAWATYLGGSGEDVGLGIALDGTGSVYVTGYTSSANFPTTAGAFQTVYGGSPADGFVTKLNAATGALVYSTYLGGSGGADEEGTAIAVDNSGNVYVAGATSSSNFPTTAGAFQTRFGGGFRDAFITKLNAAGSALVYSTYLGDNGDDYASAIAVDAAGSAYVLGSTSSANGSTKFPTTPGAFQTVLKGSNDAFVTKLAANGSALVYSTYLGGSQFDSGWRGGIAVDGFGNAYVTGVTGARAAVRAHVDLGTVEIDEQDLPGADRLLLQARAGDHQVQVVLARAAVVRSGHLDAVGAGRVDHVIKLGVLGVRLVPRQRRLGGQGVADQVGVIVGDQERAGRIDEADGWVEAALAAQGAADDVPSLELDPEPVPVAQGGDGTADDHVGLPHERDRVGRGERVVGLDLHEVDRQHGALLQGFDPWPHRNGAGPRKQRATPE